jgi:uncharacterized membrane protein
VSQPAAPRDPVATARALTAALDGLSGDIKRLTDYGIRNRHLIWALIVSLILDLALTIVIALVAVQAHDANATALSAKAAQMALCEAGNTTRAQQRQLWFHLLTTPRLPGSPPRTKAQQQQIDAFKAYISQTFAPRDCHQISSGNK